MHWELIKVNLVFTTNSDSITFVILRVRYKGRLLTVIANGGGGEGVPYGRQGSNMTRNIDIGTKGD